MKKLTTKELKEITGGSITGTILNYTCDLIEILVEAGRKLGSSLRRIKDNKLCTLDTDN